MSLSVDPQLDATQPYEDYSDDETSKEVHSSLKRRGGISEHLRFDVLVEIGTDQHILNEIWKNKFPNCENNRVDTGSYGS